MNLKSAHSRQVNETPGQSKKQKTELGKKKVQIHEIHDTENLHILQHLPFISKSF